MSDRDKKGVGHGELASYLLEVAAQLAALAKEIRALAGRRLEECGRGPMA